MNALHHAAKHLKLISKPQTLPPCNSKLKNRFRAKFPDEICIEDKIDGWLELIRPYKNRSPKMPKFGPPPETAQADKSNATVVPREAENGWSIHADRVQVVKPRLTNQYQVIIAGVSF